MADLASSPYFLLVLVISAFTLPLVFLIWIRNSVRYGKEPWSTVLKAFAWGAVFSVIIAIVFNLILLVTLGQIRPLNDFFARRFSDPLTVIGALIVAPFVEEAAKGLGVRAGRPQTQSNFDGLVYGAAAGLGFSATENLLNGLVALAQPELGASGSLLIIAIRSFSSSLLHASSSAVMGYGLAKGWLTGRSWAFFPFYIVAIIMHAAFNFLAVVGSSYASQYGEFGEAIAFVAAIGFAVTAITIIRFKLASKPPAMAR